MVWDTDNLLFVLADRPDHQDRGCPGNRLGRPAQLDPVDQQGRLDLCDMCNLKHQ